MTAHKEGPFKVEEISPGEVHVKIGGLVYSSFFSISFAQECADKMNAAILTSGWSSPETVKELKGERDRMRGALERIRDRTRRDAEGPELRCQNENNYKDAVEALKEPRP